MVVRGSSEMQIDNFYFELFGAVRSFLTETFLLHRNGTKIAEGFGTCYINTHTRTKNMHMIRKGQMVPKI